MSKDQLRVLAKGLIASLHRTGYTQRESGDIILAAAQLIKEVRYEKNSKVNNKNDDRSFIYDDRSSIL